MDLFLRKVIHPQAHDNYRVLIKDNGAEIGSIAFNSKAGTGASTRSFL
jgi:hypothetical protein